MDSERLPLHWAARRRGTSNNSGLFLAVVKDIQRLEKIGDAGSEIVGICIASALAYSTQEPWLSVRAAIARQERFATTLPAHVPVEAFAAGVLSGDVADLCRAHLVDCDECLRRLAALWAADAATRRFRGFSAARISSIALCAGLLSAALILLGHWL